MPPRSHVVWKGSEATFQRGDHDPRFVRLDESEISRALAFFDNDANVKTVFQVTMNSLLSGNISFRHKGDTNNRYHGSTDDEKWQSMVYSELCREIVRHLWAIGFAVVTYVPHPKYGARPVVLNIERTEAYYYLDVFNTPHFRFFERLQFPDSGGSSTSDFFLGLGGKIGQSMDINRREIPNIHVFCTDAPANNGALRSRIMLLAPDLLFESHLLSCCMEADRQRANPSLVSEKDPPKSDRDAYTINNAGDVGPRSAVQSSFEGDGNQPGPLSEAQIRSIQKDVMHLDHVGALMQEGMTRGSLDPNTMISRRKLMHGHTVEEIQLETGRKLTHQVVPESPHEMLIKFRNARMERVLALFSVPMGMISQQSSLGSKTSMTENSFIVYLDAQKYLKQLLISYLYEVYHHINDSTFAMDYLVDTIEKKKGKPTVPGLKQALKCEITMPGLPPEETVERLFLLGVLKYEAYTKFLHDKHAIPGEDFNEKPELSLTEMSQIKTDDELAGPGGKRKSATKSGGK